MRDEERIENRENKMTATELQNHILEQNKAIVRLARAIASTYGGSMAQAVTVITDVEVLKVLGMGGYHVLEQLGDILNMMGAVTEKDEKLVTPMLEKSKELFSSNE